MMAADGWAGMLLGLTLGLFWIQRSQAWGRGHLGNASLRPSEQRTTGQGLDATLADAIAHVASGGNLADLFPTAEGSRDPWSSSLVRQTILPVLQAQASPKDSLEELTLVADGISLAGRLSQTLGSPIRDCLQAVLEDQGRRHMLDDLTTKAFAVPRMTIRLLSALPLLTLAFAYLMGAQPHRFLLASPQGLACLALGLCSYAAGMVWVRSLMAKAGRRAGSSAIRTGRHRASGREKNPGRGRSAAAGTGTGRAAHIGIGKGKVGRGGRAGGRS
ncbi:hypothetical protein [Bifidobacterium aemilianum]|nr:hypothetical protein [Bifidobacterium aemilianum]